MGPLPFSIKTHFLPLPLQNPLDHVSVECRRKNMSFGDLEHHGHSDIFSLM